MNTRSHAVNPAIHRQAMQWLVTMWSGETTQSEQRALEQWRRADPEHERAWQQVQGLGRAMQDIPAELGSALRSAPIAKPARRTVLRSLLGIGAVGLASYGSYSLSQQGADFSSERHARRELTLPDGTQVSMNVDTAFDLRFDGSSRQLLLRRGEILVTTGHEAPGTPYRPFSVVTAQGNVRALGTRFAVRQQDQLTRVAVFEGSVALTPAEQSQPARVLHTGEAADFNRQEILFSYRADPARVAWSKGLLIAEQMRLVDFLAELGRYRSGILRCDDLATDLIVSGVYPLNNTDLALDTLTQALPVQLHSITRYWVTVSKKN